ncbi:MAG TPA: hypothetical protein VGP21_00010 [Opitutaceae bacterium]|jgi:hypothetical protein|nr:hypothetical protein [Opitutaceae bacterium]
MKHPFLLYAASTAFIALSAGCNKTPPPPPASSALPPPTPESVVARLTQPNLPAILPHKIDPATAFPQALASLSPTGTAPKVLAPSAPASKGDAPAATSTDDEQTTNDYKIVDPNRPPTKGLTADGVTTDLVMHDWTGIVLVPLDTSVSRAHTILVAIDRIEAHPLDNGQVRIWTRIRNVTDGPLPSEVACSFRTAESAEPERPIFYKLDIPRGDYRDVFFVSPEGRNLNSYTVLVRAGGESTSASGTLH